MAAFQRSLFIEPRVDGVDVFVVRLYNEAKKTVRRVLILLENHASPAIRAESRLDRRERKNPRIVLRLFFTKLDRFVVDIGCTL